MNLKEKAMVMALTGFGLYSIFCVLITTLISTASAGDGNLYVCSTEFTEWIGDPLRAFLIEALACGLFGSVIMGATVVYEIEQWSLLKATLIHLAAGLCSFLATGFFLKWVSPHDIKKCAGISLIWIAIYFIIWLRGYMSYKADVSVINSELSVLKSRE